MSKAVECWKTAFSPSSSAYESVYVPPPDEASQHFVHGQCCGVPGLVEQYDLYTPISSSHDDMDANNTIKVQHPEVTVAVIRLGRNLGGYPGTLHGGAAALLFDDVVGFAADQVLDKELQQQPSCCHDSNDPPRRTSSVVVTANLQVDFLTAVPTGTVVLLQVRAVSRQGRKIDLAAQMTNLECTIVYAQSRVLYMIPRSSL